MSNRITLPSCTACGKTCAHKWNKYCSSECGIWGRNYRWSTPIPPLHPVRSTLIPIDHPAYVGPPKGYRLKPNAELREVQCRSCGKTWLGPWTGGRPRIRCAACVDADLNCNECRGCGRKGLRRTRSYCDECSLDWQRYGKSSNILVVDVPPLHPVKSSMIPIDHPVHPGEYSIYYPVPLNEYRVQQFTCSICGLIWSRPVITGPEPKRCYRCVPEEERTAIPQSLRMFIYIRDQGRCHLCTLPVDFDLIGSSDKMRPSLDHVVPWSRGGTDDQDNLRLAHLSCNARRCDRMLSAA